MKTNGSLMSNMTIIIISLDSLSVFKPYFFLLLLSLPKVPGGQLEVCLWYRVGFGADVSAAWLREPRARGRAGWRKGCRCRLSRQGRTQAISEESRRFGGGLIILASRRWKEGRTASAVTIARAEEFTSLCNCHHHRPCEWRYLQAPPVGT